jgi:transcriptional regulator with XRE-family HTH domain
MIMNAGAVVCELRGHSDLAPAMRRNAPERWRSHNSRAMLTAAENCVGSLLRRCRLRIAPGRPSLGPHLRLPLRIGRTVSQEEVAEAVGISREWYARMERGRSARPSNTTLSALADALMMTAAERATLFQNGAPELRSAFAAQTSTAVLDAIGALRRLVRGLRTATTQAEALSGVREYARTQVSPETLVTYTGSACSHGDRDATPFFGVVDQRWGASFFDDVHCCTGGAQPGELITRSEIHARCPHFGTKAQEALDAVGWADMSIVVTDGGLLWIHQPARPFSETESAQLRTAAEVASLALARAA